MWVEDLLILADSSLCEIFPGEPVSQRRFDTSSTSSGIQWLPEGVATLRSAVQALPRNEEIVIYCGCCPMKNCPNIRPAYRVLKELGFERLGVLDLPTNFHTDCVAKGYPVET